MKFEISNLRFFRTLPSRQKVSLVLLFFYWPFLFFLTHAPFAPEILKEFQPSDKALHFLVFFMLAFLLYSALCNPKKLVLKNYSVWLTLILIVFYAAFDEWLQGFCGRNRSFFDFTANLAGILCAFVLLIVFVYRYAALLCLGLSIIIMTFAVQMEFVGRLSAARSVFYLISYSLLTFLWIQYFVSSFSAGAFDVKWFIAALALPTGHLSATFLLSLLVKNSFGFRDVSVSFAAIVILVLIIYVFSLVKNSSAQKHF